MSDLRKAAQQALEALEQSRAFVTTREKIKHPEGTEWYDERITALKQALAEPEQEPVAWVEPKWLDPDTRGWPSDSFASQPIEGWLPLYTAPAPRKPVELTDEEIIQCWTQLEGTTRHGYVFFCRAVIAAYEAKNGIGEQQ